MTLEVRQAFPLREPSHDGFERAVMIVRNSGVERVRKARELHDYDVSRRVDPQELTIDANGEEGSSVTAGVPPLGAVASRRIHAREVCPRHQPRVGPGPDACCPVVGAHPMASDRPSFQHEQAEAGQIAQRDRDTAVREREPGLVDGDEGVVLGADPRPDGTPDARPH